MLRELAWSGEQLALYCNAALRKCDENVFVNSNIKTEVEVLSPSQIQMQPDEFIQELQTIKDTPSSINSNNIILYFNKKKKRTSNLIPLFYIMQN